MAQSRSNHSAALLAELGFGAGCRSAGGVALGGVALQTGCAATLALVLDDTGADAGATADGGALIPLMAQGGGIISHKGTATAVAQVDGLAASLAGSGSDVGLVVVGQGGGDIGDVAVAANRTLLDSITG